MHLIDLKREHLTDQMCLPPNYLTAANFLECPFVIVTVMLHYLRVRARRRP
jgi:hypothetical protein